MQCAYGCPGNGVILSRSGKHLTELIDDVLEMSKIEAGQTTLAKADIDLHLLLDGMEEMIRPWAEKETCNCSLTMVPAFRSCIDLPERHE